MILLLSSGIAASVKRVVNVTMLPCGDLRQDHEDDPFNSSKWERNSLAEVGIRMKMPEIRKALFRICTRGLAVLRGIDILLLVMCKNLNHVYYAPREANQRAND
jgi:hypothetical protein